MHGWGASIARDARAKGEAEGKAEGEARGIGLGRADAVRRLMRNLHMDQEQAMDALGLEGAEREACRKLLESS